MINFSSDWFQSLLHCMRGCRTVIALLTMVSVWSIPAGAQTLKLAVTTTFEDSGLSSVLLPALQKDTGLKVHLIVVGTGRALLLGENGDVDALLVHFTQAELKFVADGFAKARFDVMYNDFVVVGPVNDPANIRETKTAQDAFHRIATSRAKFISRGDDSGTHRKELELWTLADIANNTQRGEWYRAAGAGMGATLNIAAASRAYTMSDRGTWLRFKNKRDLKLLFEGDAKLRNQYGLMIVNPDRHPHVHSAEAETFLEWITSEKGQSVIGAYLIDGERAFIPNAGKAISTPVRTQ